MCLRLGRAVTGSAVGDALMLGRVLDLLRAWWARGGCRCLTPSSKLKKGASAGNSCSPLKHMENLHFSSKEGDELAQRARLWIRSVLLQMLRSIGKELILKAADT